MTAPHEDPASATAPARPRKVGRRPAGSDTRGEVLDAARAEFGARGYDGASIRAIARTADVNSALVHHYFGTKQRLFLAALDFPLDPSAIAAHILDGERATIGERTVRLVVRVWEDPDQRDRLLAALRAAGGNEQFAALLRGFMRRELVEPLAAALGGPDAALRVELAMSQIVGLAMARYVLAVEPLASASPERLVELVGPTVQRYLT